MNIAYNADCMEIMRQYPDKYFDLAVVDPPYGAGGVHLPAVTGQGSAGGSTDTRAVSRTGGGWSKWYDPSKKS